MRRSAAATALTLALMASVTSVAGAKGGNFQLKIPAPKVGQATVQLVTFHIKAHGKAPKLTLKITHLAALGKGFDAVAAIPWPKAGGSNVTVKVMIVMFMGNLSTAPASTINLQTNEPAGEVKASTKDVTKDCDVVGPVKELERAGVALALAHIGDGESPPGTFWNNTTGYLCHK